MSLAFRIYDVNTCHVAEHSRQWMVNLTQRSWKTSQGLPSAPQVTLKEFSGTYGRPQALLIVEGLRCLLIDFCIVFLFYNNLVLLFFVQNKLRHLFKMAELSAAKPKLDLRSPDPRAQSFLRPQLHPRVRSARRALCQATCRAGPAHAVPGAPSSSPWNSVR